MMCGARVSLPLSSLLCPLSPSSRNARAAAGATAVAAAAPVIGLSAASGVAIGAALLAPIVIGFMMDRVIDVATGEVAPPEWAQGPKGEER